MERPLRVLIAEDNPADAALIVLELRRGGFAPDWVRVDTEAEFAARLHPDLDVILSDYEMPGFSGTRAIEVLNERGLEIPFILISGTIGEDTAVAAMKRGAADYLLKDRLGRLGPAVGQALEQGRLRRERKQADVVLRESERRFREQAAMLDSAHDAIIVRGIHSRKITFWNQGAERLYGWTAAEALGADIGELLFRDPTLPDQVAARLLETGEWRGEQLHRSQSGKELTVSSHATLVRDAEGRPKSALVINIDITAQKNLEARLLRAQRMESIGTLAAGVAHDLNNILAPIMMSVPVLRQNLTPAQREGIISTIEMSAERGSQIVRQVLTFGRGLEGERCPVDLGTLITELVGIVSQTFPKNIAVESSIAPGLRPVEADATQFHQVLLNLAVNARDAMPGGGKLRLSASNLDVDASYSSMLPEAETGSYVLVEVADSGGGIPPHLLERIFDPFFTTKPVGKGTGLGLSTAVGIVRSHGGFIHVTSTPGRGTTFQIHLPAASNGKTAPDPAARECLPEGYGELILVVDDEAAVTAAVRTVLEAHGYRVLLAPDGTQALAIFERNADHIAAVLTDIVMPCMDGVALVRALVEKAPALPIIASTGLGEKTQVAVLREMGVERVLRKPYGADTLLRTLHGALHS